MAFDNIGIQPEPTPNPNSVRFVIGGRRVMERGTVDFHKAEDAGRSRLATELFKLQGVAGVFLGPNFLTVTTEKESDWDEIAMTIMEKLREMFEDEAPLIEGGGDEPQYSSAEEGEVVAGIIKIIEEEIRPAVAMDGGDIVFGSYEDGIVKLMLRGACSGCPSSTATLKMGIERRLQEAYPEVVSVEAML